MKGKAATYLVHLALLFITVSFVQVCCIDLVEANSAPRTPSIPSGITSGLSGTYYSYITKATDSDGDQVRYKFDWGDGTSTTCLVSQNIAIKLRHKWAVASGSKTFNVRAQAIDEHGVASSWSGPLSVTIKASSTSTPITPTTVSNKAPATPSVPSGPTSGSSGTSYSYSAKATDPDGNRVKYTIDWGDSTPFTTTSLVSSGTSASASHAWTVAAGTTKTFSVRARAVDEKGTASSWSSALSVSIKGPATTYTTSSSNNAPGKPSIPKGTVVGNTKYSYTYETKSTDPNGDQVKFMFNWGDGTTTTTGYVASGSLVSASHQWPDATPGWGKGYDITAKAIDIHGMESAWSTAYPISMVTDPVNHPPAMAKILSGPTTGVSGKSYTFSASSTDPDGDYIKYIFNWGDGSTSTDYFPSGQAVSASHSWTVPAGEKWDCKVKVYCADSNYARCPYPYFSDPWIVAVSGPSIASSQSGLEAEGMDIEEANSADMEINESDSIDDGAEETELFDEQTNESDSLDEEVEETELFDEQTNESDSLDEKGEEDCPIAMDDFYSISSAGNITEIGTLGVLENDQYGGYATLSVIALKQPLHASNFSLNPDGSFTYTSSQGYCGEDSFTYKITNGYCESNEAIVTIFVDCGQQNEEEMTLRDANPLN